MTIRERVNGKLIPVVIFIITFAVGYGTLRAKVDDNCKEIASLSPTRVQIGKVETKLEDLEQTVHDFKEEYRDDQQVLQEDIKEILRSVK